MSKSISRYLYIDASNFFGGMVDMLPMGNYFEFSSLLAIIESVFGPINTIKAYGAYMRASSTTDPLQLGLAQTQKAFFDTIRSKDKVIFYKGSISKHGSEKGVDMHLGIDMVHDADRGKYDEAILMSGDTDFLYPVELVRLTGKTLHLCTLASRFTPPLGFRTATKVILDYGNYFSEHLTTQKRALPQGIIVVPIAKLALIRPIKNA